MTHPHLHSPVIPQGRQHRTLQHVRASIHPSIPITIAIIAWISAAHFSFLSLLSIASVLASRLILNIQKPPPGTSWFENTNNNRRPGSRSRSYSTSSPVGPFVTSVVGVDTSATISFSRPPGQGRLRERTHVREAHYRNTNRDPVWHDVTFSSSRTTTSLSQSDSGISQTIYTFSENELDEFAVDEAVEGKSYLRFLRNLKLLSALTDLHHAPALPRGTCCRP